MVVVLLVLELLSIVVKPVNVVIVGFVKLLALLVFVLVMDIVVVDSF